MGGGSPSSPLRKLLGRYSTSLYTGSTRALQTQKTNNRKGIEALVQLSVQMGVWECLRCELSTHHLWRELKKGREGSGPKGAAWRGLCLLGEVSVYAGAWGWEVVALWAEGVYDEQQANWLETFCKRWKRSLKEFAVQREREILKKRVPGMRIERMPYWNEAVVGAGGPERAR